MKRLLTLPLLLAALPTFAAPIYQCQNNGTTLYTQNPRGNCQNAQLGHPSRYTPAPSPTHNMPSENNNNETHNDNTTNNPSPNTELASARQQLAQAQANLEAGKKIRYGNERNYARYLARIQGLENAVKQAQEKVNQLSQ